MRKDFYSEINDYKEERDNSILLSIPQESLFLSDEQQKIYKFSLSDYNNNTFFDYSPLPNSQQLSPFPSVSSNKEEINKSSIINSLKKLDEISRKDEKKNRWNYWKK